MARRSSLLAMLVEELRLSPFHAALAAWKGRCYSCATSSTQGLRLSRRDRPQFRRGRSSTMPGTLFPTGSL